MICSCGKETEEGKRFCGYCGQAFEEVASVPSAEKKCRLCGFVLKEGSKFCPKCGTAAEHKAGSVEGGKRDVAVAEEDVAETKKSHDIPSDEKKPKVKAPRKKRIKTVYIVISAILLVGIAAGIYCGVYVAQNGWDAVPFAEKLTFLPFVRLSKPTMETYIVEAETEEESAEEDVEKLEPDQMQEPAAYSYIQGNWTCADEGLTIFLRYKGDGTFYLIDVTDYPAEETYKLSVEGTYEIKDYDVGDTLLMNNEYDGTSYAALIKEEAVDVIIANKTYAFTRTMLDDAQLSGTWRAIKPDNGMIIAFSAEGYETGYVENDGNLCLYDTVADYRYENDVIMISDPQNGTNRKEYRIEVFGKYALLFIQEHSAYLLERIYEPGTRPTAKRVPGSGFDSPTNPAPAATPAQSELPIEQDVVSLFTLTPFLKYNWDPNLYGAVDGKGNSQSFVSSYLAVGNGNYAEYSVNGAFVELSGKIVSHERMHENGEAKLIVFADDVVVYSSPIVNRNTSLFDFRADISGANNLRLEVVGVSATTSRWLLILDLSLRSGNLQQVGVSAFDSSSAEPPSGATLSDRDFILPQSSSRYLTNADLASLSKEELRIARNEIYARHGRIFATGDLSAYFNSKAWYRGTVHGDDFDVAVFNSYEKKNVALIGDYERQL